MTYSQEATDLLQRYLWRVERRLPSAQAADVVAELDSLLRDQLDARAEATGRAVDEDLVCAVLRGFGSPEETATRYSASSRYLIGPAAYPVFLKVAGWVLGGMTLVVLLQTLLQILSAHSRGLGWIFLSALAAWYQSVLFTLAWVVLIFAILERTQSKGWPPKLDWDPRDLPELPRREEDKVALPAQFMSLLLPLLLLFVLNTNPNWAGLVLINKAQVQVLRFTDLGFHLPMVWINLCLGLQLLLDLTVLQIGRWNAGLRWARVFLGLLGAGILAWIVSHAIPPSPQALDTLAREGGLPAPVLKVLVEFSYGFGKLLPVLALISPAKRAFKLGREMRWLVR